MRLALAKNVLEFRNCAWENLPAKILVLPAGAGTLINFIDELWIRISHFHSGNEVTKGKSDSISRRK